MQGDRLANVARRQTQPTRPQPHEVLVHVAMAYGVGRFANPIRLMITDKAQFKQENLDSIPGWLSPQAQVFSERLVRFQNDHDYTTGILEFGVFKGKYLALLTHLVGEQRVPVVGVDAFLEKARVKLRPEHRESAEREIHHAVELVTGQPSEAVLIGGFTREVDVTELTRRAPEGYSFISVDAGHDAEDLAIDCPMAEHLLSDCGIVAFDDVFNAVTPGVAEGFFRYFIESDEPRLAAFATCGNKVFMCKPGMYDTYFQFAQDLALRAEREMPLLATTTRHVQANTDNNWTPRLFGRSVVPFL